MGVAEDYGSKSCNARIEVELLHVMQYVKTDTADLEHLRFGKIPAPGGSIDVSSHCGHRRKLAELIEDRSVADVPGVHYGIHSTQSF